MKRRRLQIDLGPAEIAALERIRALGDSDADAVRRALALLARLAAGIEAGFTLALVPREERRFPDAALELTEAIVPSRRRSPIGRRSHSQHRGQLHVGACDTKEACLEILREERSALETAGIRHAALFGSAARDRLRVDSDVDVLVDVDSNVRMDLFDFAAIRERLVAAFGREVDMVTKRALKPDLDAVILREAVYAF
jgi:predicted nucleotidyltransferase